MATKKTAADVLGAQLIEAVDRASPTGVERAIAQGAFLEAWDHRESTAAMIAAETGRDACLALLIAAGAAIDAHPAWPSGVDAPLRRAAARGHERCVELLLAAGADPDAKGRFEAPVFAAITGNHAGCLRRLALAGADLGARSASLSRTPLTFAAERGREECVAILLEAGCDLDARDARGRGAERCAEIGGHERCAAMIAAERERRELSKSVPGADGSRGKATRL